MSDFETLVHLAEDSTQSSYRRRQAVSDLLRDHCADTRTISLLNKMLGEADVHLKRDLIGAFKSCDAPEILSVVIPLLDESDDYLRRDIIQLMGRVGSKEELALLQPLCADGSFSVNYAAKQAVKDIESRSALEVEEEEPADVPVEDAELVEEPEPEVVVDETPVEELTEEPEPEPEPEVAVDETPVEELTEEPEAEPEVAVDDTPVEELTEPEPDAAEKSTDKNIEEIHPEKQKLPKSLHDNSIFGDKSVAEVSDEVSSSLQTGFSETAPLLSSSNDPQNSQNLKQFFYEEYQLSLALYRQLATSSAELPVKENALSNCLHRLTLLEADKADDLEASKESVKESSKETKDAEWDVKKTEQAIINLEKENKELLNSIMFIFSSAKKDEAFAQKAKLKKKLRRLKKELSNEEGELKGLIAEKKSLQEPLILLRNEFKKASSDRDSLLEKIYQAESEINQLILKVIMGAGENSLKSRLDFMEKSKSPIAGSVVQRLIRLKNSLSTYELKHRDLEDELEVRQQAAFTETDMLGEELSKSLVLKSASKKERVKVKASLSFKEEESFFSFSNASGSASGRGEASASMLVEELIWRESPSLKNAVHDFSSAFDSLGSFAARIECAGIDIQTTQAAMRHYIDYLRCAIESDFGN
jgi:hypothetical protein